VILLITEPRTKISILIVDDSSLFRRVLSEKLSAFKYLQIIGEAENGKEAIEKTRELLPDIILLDCEMPVLSGIDALSVILKENPFQKVIMFSAKTLFGADITIKALEIGAVDFMPKPAGGFNELDAVLPRLAGKIRLANLKNKLVEQKTIEFLPDPSHVNALIDPLLNSTKKDIKLILIGSSTGGVNAALDIVPKLKKSYPPIVWIQHMPEAFTKSFAQRLDKASSVNFKEAEDGEILRKGCGYVAPGGKQLEIIKAGGNDFCVKIVDDIDSNIIHKPCVNKMLMSVDDIVKGPEVLCLILTGMGDDGTIGLKKLHSKGAFVIGQSMRTCIVYGMPHAAKVAGAVDVELDLQDIPFAIQKILGC